MNVQEITIQTFDYSFKKPNGGTFKTNIDIIGKTISLMGRGYSPVIVVVGKQRSGKSFFTIWFAKIIHDFFHPDEPFDPTKYTFYEPGETLEMIDSYTLEPLIIDEAGAIFNKQEWYLQVTLAMNKIIQTQGWRNNVYIFVCPFGNDVVKAFRKHFDFIAHTISRGHIVVKRISKKYDEMNDVKIKTLFYEKIKLRRRDLDPEVWQKYEQYSIQRKKEMYGDLTAKSIHDMMPVKDPFGRDM